LVELKVKLFETFREGRGKEVLFNIEHGTQVGKVLDMLGIKEEEIAILLVNGRDSKLDTQLLEGDYISLFPPVGGG